MPITVDAEIRNFSRDEFHSIAESVIGIAFGIHNQLGRLMNEDVYKYVLRNRCESLGITPARREVRITVTHRDFEKAYFMDLLLANGMMVEAKTVERLTNTHHTQAIHYLLLSGIQHGLLINLRPGSVEKQFVTTTLDIEGRRRYTIHDSDWTSANHASTRLRDVFGELLTDWGAFLDTTLYREAVIHFFGGPELVLQKVPIYDGDHEIGSQEHCLISDDTALALTSLKTGQGAMNDHLYRFLCHTKLKCIQWINLNRHDIEFRTLTQ